MSIQVDGKIAFNSLDKSIGNIVFLTPADRTRILAMTDAASRQDAINARSIESVYFLTKENAAAVKAGTRTLSEFRLWHRYDGASPTVVWGFVDMAGETDIRPCALIHLNDPVKLVSFTTYTSMEIKAINDIFTEFGGTYTEEAFDTSLCKTVGTTSMFSLDSCTKLDVQTESGEDIYKTVVKVATTDGYIVLASSTNNYMVMLDHRDGYNQNLETKYAYTTIEQINESLDFLTPARNIQHWTRSNTAGGQWQGNANCSTVFAGKCFLIELNVQDLFDTDPIEESVITGGYNDIDNLFTWTISKDGYDVSSFVKHYEVVMSGHVWEDDSSFSKSFTVTDMVLNFSNLPDGSVVPNGDYQLTIHAVSKKDPTIMSLGTTWDITVDQDTHTHEYAKVSNGKTLWVEWTPTTDVIFDSIEFLTLDSSTNLANDTALIASYDATAAKITKIANLKLQSTEIYKAKATDGSTLYKRSHVPNSTTDIAFTAGTTYLISFNVNQWGDNYIVWHSDEDTNSAVKTTEAWGPTTTTLTNTDYLVNVNLNHHTQG